MILIQMVMVNVLIVVLQMDVLMMVMIVMVVIFLFMGSIRTVLVPIIAIPISMIGAVFLMQLFGFSIH